MNGNFCFVSSLKFSFLEKVGAIQLMAIPGARKITRFSAFPKFWIVEQPEIGTNVWNYSKKVWESRILIYVEL